MEINTNLDSLPIITALASESRLKIINLLSKGEYNIKDIADELYLSSGIVTRHVKQLEEAGIIQTEIVTRDSKSHKICRLAVEELYIRFPKSVFPTYKFHGSNIPVGHYTNYYATPTCGLASAEKHIGELDDPKYFMDAERMNAELVWFTEGFLEYKIPNLLNKSTEKPELLEISLEMASEFPVSNNNWPSDISFYINETFVGSWTVPGNFSDVRGKLTPEWWPDRNSQYGLLKTLRVTPHETLMDGEKISDVTLHDIDWNKSLIDIRFSVEKTSENVGGLTIFGKKFGNYPQDIQYRLYYSKK